MDKHTQGKVDGVPQVERSFFVGDPAQLFIGGVAKNPDEVLPLRDFMGKLHARIPGSIGFASQAALFARGIGEGRAVELVLKGSDLGELTQTGQALFRRLQAAVPGSRVRPVPVLDLGAPELHIFPRREQLELSAMSSEEMALVADAYIDGARIGDYGKDGERKLDVLIKSGDLEDRVVDEAGLLSAPVAD
jgi:HAE1 family hydrophobic/amphiphilic exporter-1